MADAKISQLPVATTPLTGTELVPVVQGGVTDQTTVEAILTGTVPSGTANGVLYLDGSKVVTSGSALTFDGATLGVNGVSVGRGAGAVSTNTAVGASALAANTTGSENAAFGSNALAANTSGYSNNAFGYGALDATTNSNNNSAFGDNALGATTSGNSNSAFGSRALFSNTTASNNTAVGYQAGYSNTTGAQLTALGVAALYTNTTATENTAVGYAALRLANAGIYQSALGAYAGYSLTTGTGNTFLGAATGYNTTTGSFNTFVGVSNGFYGAGHLITTGSKNTILGGYNGNQGGLDIRTADNYIVLSDGDGNPRLLIDNAPKVIGTSPQVFSTLQDANAFQAAYRTGYYATGTISKRYMPGFGMVGQSNDGYVQHTVIGQVRSSLWGDTYIAVGGNDSYPTSAVYFGLGGTVGLNTETPNSGTGITFPATQSASSDANTLDDYEEGTWTPTAQVGGVSVTCSGAQCFYTKVGNVVHICGSVTVTRGSQTGGLRVFGFPFAIPVGTFPVSASWNLTTASGYTDGLVFNNAYDMYLTGQSGLLTLGSANMPTTDIELIYNFSWQV